MNVKMLLPWLCVVALLAGSGWLYSSNLKRGDELAKLREENQQLQQARAEAEAASNRQKVSEDELTRLRQGQEELLRLRNEVRQLRDAKDQLGKQAQLAQAQAQTIQAQAQALRQTPAPATAADPADPAQAAAREAFARRYGLSPLTPEQASSNACVANLRLIEAAKQQWAVDNNKPKGALMTMENLTPYFKTNGPPVCPSSGIYTLNPAGISPTCTIQGHALK